MSGVVWAKDGLHSLRAASAALSALTSSSKCSVADKELEMSTSISITARLGSVSTEWLSILFASLWQSPGIGEKVGEGCLLWAGCLVLLLGVTSLAVSLLFLALLLEGMIKVERDEKRDKVSD